jgi:hypothetical protein
MEPQIMDYQTQQYRLFAGLATTYAHFFTANHLIRELLTFRSKTDNFKNVNTAELAKVYLILFLYISVGVRSNSV